MHQYRQNFYLRDHGDPGEDPLPIHISRMNEASRPASLHRAAGCSCIPLIFNAPVCVRGLRCQTATGSLLFRLFCFPPALTQLLLCDGESRLVSRRYCSTSPALGRPAVSPSSAWVTVTQLPWGKLPSAGGAGNAADNGLLSDKSDLKKKTIINHSRSGIARSSRYAYCRYHVPNVVVCSIYFLLVTLMLTINSR